MSIASTSANDDSSTAAPQLTPELSFRPAFLSKKAVSTSDGSAPSIPINPLLTAPIPATRSAFTHHHNKVYSERDDRNGGQITFAVFRERPVDELSRVYTKDYFLKRRPPASVKPAPEVVNKITEADLWIEDHDAPRSPQQRRLNERREEEGKEATPKESAPEVQRPSRTSKNPREVFRSQVQTALNKLTVDNFKKLSEQSIVALKEAKTTDLLEEAVNIFHKKVLSDSKFTNMYVDLMRIINKDLEPLKDSVTNKPITFRGLCLNKCQELFEASLEPPAKIEESNLEELSREHKNGVVNVLFLAELSRVGLLPPKLLISCLETLLAKIKSQLESRTPNGAYQAEVNAEKLSKALLVSGEVIAQKDTFQFQLMQLVYEIEQLAKWPGITPRHQYFLLDVVEASKNSWIQRRPVQGPQTILDLHTKAYLNSDPNMNSNAKAESSSAEATPTKSPTSSAATTPGSGNTKRTVVRRVVHEGESPTSKK